MPVRADLCKLFGDPHMHEHDIVERLTTVPRRLQAAGYRLDGLSYATIRERATAGLVPATQGVNFL